MSEKHFSKLNMGEIGKCPFVGCDNVACVSFSGRYPDWEWYQYVCSCCKDVEKQGGAE